MKYSMTAVLFKTAVHPEMVNISYLSYNSKKKQKINFMLHITFRGQNLTDVKSLNEAGRIFFFFFKS